MRKNRYDRIMDKMLNRIERVSDKMAKEFKGTNPFDKEPVSNDEALYEYENMGYEKFEQIANTQGLEAAVGWRDEMEALKQRRAR